MASTLVSFATKEVAAPWLPDDAVIADLWNATLQGADLMYANLRGAKNLTIGQLSQVKTLVGAQLDGTLLLQIKKNHPQLLTSKIAGKN